MKLPSPEEIAKSCVRFTPVWLAKEQAARAAMLAIAKALREEAEIDGSCFGALRDAAHVIEQAAAQAKEKAVRHEDSGYRCAVFHFKEVDGRRVSTGQCTQCKHCGEWIRPGHMDDECLGHVQTQSEKREWE